MRDAIAPDQRDRVVVVTVDDVREIHGVPLGSPLLRSEEIVPCLGGALHPDADMAGVGGPRSAGSRQRRRSETTPATRMTSSNNPSVNVVAGRMPRGYRPALGGDRAGGVGLAGCQRWRSVTGWVTTAVVGGGQRDLVADVEPEFLGGRALVHRHRQQPRRVEHEPDGTGCRVRRRNRPARRCAGRRRSDRSAMRTGRRYACRTRRAGRRGRRSTGRCRTGRPTAPVRSRCRRRPAAARPRRAAAGRRRSARRAR